MAGLASTTCLGQTETVSAPDWLVLIAVGPVEKWRIWGGKYWSVIGPTILANQSRERVGETF